jgi:hypothetical protein
MLDIANPGFVEIQGTRPGFGTSLLRGVKGLNRIPVIEQPVSIYHEVLITFQGNEKIQQFSQVQAKHVVYVEHMRVLRSLQWKAKGVSCHIAPRNIKNFGF